MKKYFKIIIIVGILVLIIIAIFKKQAKFGEEIRNTIKYSSEIPTDYLRLFNLKQQCCKDALNDNFYFCQTLENTERNPISYFIYKKQYFLQIYKMDTLFNLPLNKILDEQYANAKMSVYPYYLQYNKGPIDFFYKFSKPVHPTAIYLKIFGKNNKVVLKNIY